MGTITTSLTVTIVTKVPSPSQGELLLEAEIAPSDNDGNTIYYIGESYVLRLFKSTNISTITAASTIGTVTKSGSGLTTEVPYADDDDDYEYVTFSGSETASLNKVYESNLKGSFVGSVFDKNGNHISPPSVTPTKGSKTLTASKKIYGVYQCTYITKYDTYDFSSSSAGPMLILFIGSDS